MATSHMVFDEWSDLYADRVNTMKTSAVRDLFSAATRSDIISLSGGMPDIRNLPLDLVSQVVASAIQKDGVSALQYGSSDGRVGTREVIAAYLNESGIDVAPDQMMLTTGSQQALDLIGKTFINPGDAIITEGPTYLSALQAFSAYQPEVHAIDLDVDGMRMDLLEEELKKIGRGRCKFIYTIPNFQNPTGITMVLERRRRLIELAHEYGTVIIEDDPYGCLRYAGEPVPAIRSLDSQTIYLGTISKMFAPGLRLGWILAPRPILDKLLLVKQGTDLCGSAFSQVVVEYYFNDMPWRSILDSLIEIYKPRRAAMLAALEEYFAPEATWTSPEGGFFVWATLPEYLDTDQMLPLALERGVTYVPGAGCYPDGRGKSSLRMAFCYEEPESIEEAIRRLSEVIEARMELYRAFIKAGLL
jgi:2-aminoadipate transaminase